MLVGNHHSFIGCALKKVHLGVLDKYALVSGAKD